jgi:hypothetical protein
MINHRKIAVRYYVAVRPQTNELHAVHKESCPFLPDEESRIFLGLFKSPDDATSEGIKYFKRSNSCLFCTKEQYDLKSVIADARVTESYCSLENFRILSLSIPEYSEN